MIIENIYPEICNLFGDQGNIRYLRHCLKTATFHDTMFPETPLFVTQKPDMIYMGGTTESYQDKIIELWRPYQDRLKELIADGVVMLFTGNAGEILFQAIENPDGSAIPGLNIFPMIARRPKYDRYNGLTLGLFQDRLETIGFRCQFTFWYEQGPVTPFVKCQKGIGQNPQSNQEGVMANNCLVTSQLAPLLPYNPPLLHELLKKMGADGPLAFEDVVTRVYEKRLREFHRATTRFEIQI